MHVTLGKLTLPGIHRLLCITINQPYPKWAMLKTFHEKKNTLWSHSFGTHRIHCPLCFTERISTSKALRRSAMVGVVVGCY